MLAKQIFEELASKLGETIANSPAKDVEKNAKALFTSALSKMDLVTREEFDVQQQVLIKTRTKLSEVEARLAALEAIVNPQPEGPIICETFSQGARPVEILEKTDDAPAEKSTKKSKTKSEPKSEA